MKSITYFGTDLTKSGHYFYTLLENSFCYLSQRYADNIPFHPDYLGATWQQKGFVNYITINGLAIICVIGSPHDKRPGSKSVFWVDGVKSFDELKDIIEKTPIAKTILEKIGNVTL